MSVAVLDRPQVVVTDVPAEDAFWEWEAWRVAELERDRYNGRVGMTLVSQTERVRVWSIDLPPGGRLPFHRHVLDYFWTCLRLGRRWAVDQRRAGGCSGAQRQSTQGGLSGPARPCATARLRAVCGSAGWRGRARWWRRA